MITLKQLVKEQDIMEMSDIQIIKAFFEVNDLEEEGMDLIHELSRTKIKKLKSNERIVRDWTSYLPSKYLYENYDLETADWLHTLELDFLTHGEKLTKNRLEWAKENVPKILRPEVYFNPLVEWMEKQGIQFQKREK